MRGRAITLVTLAGVVVLVAFTAFALRLVEGAVRDQAEARVRSIAELTARLVGEQQLRFEEVVGAYGRRLATVAPPVQARQTAEDAATTRQTLEALVQGVDGLESAVLTDGSGRLVAAYPSSRLPRRLDLSGREWFRALRGQRRTYVSRAYRSASAGHPKITVAAVEVPGVGVLVASERGRTQAFADEYGGTRGTTLTITDQAGVVVGRTGRASDLLVSRARDPRVAAALRGRSGVDVRDGVVTGYAPVPMSGWTVSADVATDEAFADVGRLRLGLVVGSAVVGFLLLWLLPLLAARLGRAREALVVSNDFQRDLLPTALPDGVVHHYTASEKRMLLGGDFLDALRTPDGSLALLIGDVCGHGPRSAALGARLRAGWRVLALEGGAVDRLAVLERLVELERADDDLYATVACVLIDPDGGRARWAVAGHPPPLIVSPRGGVEALDGVRGPALGLDTGLDFPVGEVLLHPGWSIALYTDGLIEAPSPVDGSRPGVEGLRRIVAGDVGEDGRLRVDRLLAHVAAMARADEAADDVALLVASDPTPARQPAPAAGTRG